MLLAMLTFFTKPENFENAAVKTRSGGKAGYTTAMALYLFVRPKQTDGVVFSK
jgi:hypothetical protein